MSTHSPIRAAIQSQQLTPSLNNLLKMNSSYCIHDIIGGWIMSGGQGTAFCGSSETTESIFL